MSFFLDFLRGTDPCYVPGYIIMDLLFLYYAQSPSLRYLLSTIKELLEVEHKLHDHASNYLC